MPTDQTSQQASTTNEIKVALIAAIERALNQYISMDSTATAKLAGLAGKVIAIELQDWDFTLYLLPDAQGIQVMSAYAGDADTIIKGAPVALFNMSQGDSTAATLREQNISIDGDLELGQQFNQFFKQLDIDWEEQFAQVFSKFTSESTADLFAHKLGRLADGFQQWQSQARQTLEQNIAEYLQQESKILPFAEEIEPFFSAVDTLRNDVDRLEARFQRLQAKKNAAKVD
ncbi:Protein YigP (COG3165) clustered with ubiquinone biosynthetic genes [hydrothermal vent metagenome]|uniref:Protein YigP (COG3165) clustered with ubiquinone biosynthetic genes n=1 Tax=hydrothermal vent metagenome TaxID=652676 RepID=A0A3B1ACA1_9ZZZZ